MMPTLPTLQCSVHPVANIFPMMTPEEFLSLKDDIRLHGQREPVVFWHDQLIDGRNRMLVCQALGIEAEECELDSDDDPVAYVVSHNLHRRHLSTSQRAMVAAKLATLCEGRPAKETPPTTETPPIGGVSTEEAAKTLNVGSRSVERAKLILATGSEELNAAVERDEISVAAGAEIAEMPVEDQKAVLAEGPEFTRAVAAEKRKDRKDAKAEVQAAVVPVSYAVADEYMDPNDVLAELRKLMLRINDKTILAEMLFGISDEYEKYRIPELWEEWNRKKANQR
jgi:hypothetical protein